MKLHYSVRNQHVYIPGKTRQGKSTVMLNMAAQDIQNGAGVCVIDPKGDLVSKLIYHVPEKYKDKCVYIDPDNPVPIDLLDSQSEREKDTLIGELKHIITKGQSTDGMPLMNSILNDVIRTIFDANKHRLEPKATFLDIHDFLAFSKRKDAILAHVKDKRLLERWEEFPNMKDRAPTLNRMNDYVHSHYLKTVLGCSEPKLNIGKLMDERGILLVNLGGIDEPSKLFGTILVAKIRQAAFRRHRLPESQRIPFHLYVDEFEYFQTSDFDEILSMAGGYELRLVLANQFVSQLDARIRDSIFGNIGSYIIFCLGHQDLPYYRHLSNSADTDNPAPNLATLQPHWAFFALSGQSTIYKQTNKRERPLVSYAKSIRERTLREYACKSDGMQHTSENGKPQPEGTITNELHEAQPEDTPQKETGRPPVPPVRPQQSNSQRASRPVRR